MKERQEIVTDFLEPDLIVLEDNSCGEAIDDTEIMISPIKKKTRILAGLFRLLVKNGEYVYARPADIIMIESCDHLVKVHLGINGKVRLTIRHDSLKDFLSQLPANQFMRIGRFCAINIQRLSGGSCNKQVFEFDYAISISPKHSVSHAIFTSIGK